MLFGHARRNRETGFWTPGSHWQYYHSPYKKLSGISLVTLNIFSSKKQKWIPSTIKRPHFLIALLSWKKNWNGFYSSYSSKDAFVLLTEGHVVLKIHFNGKASYCLPPRVDVFWLLLIKLQDWCVPIQGRAGWIHEKSGGNISQVLKQMGLTWLPLSLQTVRKKWF